MFDTTTATVDTAAPIPADQAAAVVADVAATDAPAKFGYDEQVALANKLLADDDGKDGKPADGLKADNDRGPDGKFKATDKNAADPAKTDVAKGDPAKDAAKPDDKTKATEAKAKVEPPAHWALPATVKEKWAGVDPDLAQTISAQSAKDRQAITRLGNNLKAFEPFDKVAREHGDYWKDAGHPAQVLDAMVKWDKVLKDPATRDRAVPEFLKLYGVDAAQFATKAADPEADPYGLPPDPMVASLRKENAALAERLARLEGDTRKVDSRLTQREQADLSQRKAAEETRLQSLSEGVSEFAKTVPDFQLLADSGDLEIAIDITRAKGITDPKQILEQAIELARWSNKDTRDKAIQDAKAAAAKEAEDALKARSVPARQAGEAAKQAAVVNVRGAPHNSPAAVSLKDAQNDILRKHGMLN